MLGAVFGVLEHPVPGGELAGRLGIGSLALGIGVGAAGVDRLEQSQGSVELALGYAFIGVCVTLNPSPPHWGLCLRPILGALRGRGAGYDRSHDKSVTFGALSAAVELRGDLLRGFGYAARVLALAPLSRPGFSIAEENGGVQRVFTLAPLGLMTLVGLSWDHRS
jgi:hypothetical protein